MKLSIIIPAYNERETIARTLELVRAVPLEKEIIVMDDGSTDGTGELLDQLAGGEVRVVHRPVNSGKGACIREALALATGEAVVIQDADTEYDPADLPALLRPLVEGRAEVVYGTRAPHFHGQQWHYRLFQRLAAGLANLLYSADISDEATCYKLFRRELLASIPLRCQGFEFCPEVTAKVCKLGRRIVEVPVRYQARTRREGKKINWKDGVVALWTLIKYRFTD